MNFEVDHQTLNDLEIFPPYDGSSNSIFGVFNKVKTLGGYNTLVNFMTYPSSDIQYLTERRESIEFFKRLQVQFLYNKRQFEMIERYLNLSIIPIRDNLLDSLVESVRNRFATTSDHYILRAGIENLKVLLYDLNFFFKKLDFNSAPSKLKEKFIFINSFIHRSEFKSFVEKRNHTISFRQIARLDNVFRRKEKEAVSSMLKILYEFEVLDSIAETSKKYNFSFPQYFNSDKPSVTIKGFFHPFIENPVGNDIEISESQNLMFLTGPNMAGKSTLMKTFGICIYLSHIGFPVPARSMQTTIFSGMISTINLNDNLSKGYSHFYSEVRRVKEALLAIKKSDKQIVIFDELFRGTNVKDAYDGSFSIISSLINIKRPIFLISSHILEVAEDLKANKKIQFKCLSSELDETGESKSYRLRDGISRERLGFEIIKRENILELLTEIIDKQT